MLQPRIIKSDILFTLGLSVCLVLGLVLWQTWLILAFAIAFLLGYAVYKLNAFKLGYFILAFCLPLSIDFQVFGGVHLFFPSEPIAIILLIGLGVKALYNTKNIEFSKLLLPSLFLVFILLVTSAFSSNIEVSLKYTLVYTLYIACFYWGVSSILNKSKQSINLIVTGYTFSYLLVTFWALYNWSGFDFNPVTVPAIFEPFYADHTIYAASGVFLFIHWMAKVLKGENYRKKLVYLFPLVFILIGLRIANSRAALLSLPVGLAVGFLVYYGFSKRHLAVTVILLIFAVFISRNEIYDWVSYNKYDSRDQNASFVERTASVGNVQTDVSNLERINRWKAALNMAQKRPLLGFGPGTFQFTYIPFQDEKWMNRLSVVDIYDIPDNSGGTVHSEPLLFLSESGGLGLFSWLVLIITWVLWVTSVDKKKRSRYLAVSAAMVSTYLFHGIFNNFLNTDKLAFLFWGAAAIMMIEVKNENPNKYLLQFGR